MQPKQTIFDEIQDEFNRLNVTAIVKPTDELNASIISGYPVYHESVYDPVKLIDILEELTDNKDIWNTLTDCEV